MSPVARERFARWTLVSAATLVVVGLLVGLTVLGKKPPKTIVRSSATTTIPSSGEHRLALQAGALGALLGASPSTDRCPWLTTAIKNGQSPDALARMVEARMTTAEKLGELVLHVSGRYENVNTGVPRLCVPPLTLQDGPAGLAFSDTGVTALPSPIGLAATFDTALAYRYGRVQGREAGHQGIDVIQGPNLNLDRVPEDGRGFETYGEDPTLASGMGDADIEGIQSEGVMAQAKHLVAYSQETYRGNVNEVVSVRSLQELYLEPFRSAITRAGVASVMCALPRLNGTFQCEDPQLKQFLASWGFSGFVRSDLGAAHDWPTALNDGTDLLKPALVSTLADDLRFRSLSMATVNADVVRMLTQMFRFHLIERPLPGNPGTPVDSPGDTTSALLVAERSVVLLKNAGRVLPLRSATTRSIAVIGADAYALPAIEGRGSSYVLPPFVSHPLRAIDAVARHGVTVSYANGGSTAGVLPSIPTNLLTPAAGGGHGLTLTISSAGSQTSEVQLRDPVAAATIRTAALKPFSNLVSGRGISSDHISPSDDANPDRAARLLYRSVGWTATPSGLTVDLSNGWGSTLATWVGSLTVPDSGVYSFSVTGSGTASMSLDGSTIVSDIEQAGTWDMSTDLDAGHHYHLVMHWVPTDNPPDGGGSGMALGMTYDGAAIDQAVAHARAAQVAVVFASDRDAEGNDRPNLELPGDQNTLIEDVARANPHTIVVLNTGGPVLMPWLRHVAAVLEAWYPGEEDGNAIAAVLYGKVDPCGHLPVTFPSTQEQSPIKSSVQWPGVNLVATYTEGLDVGYRYFAQTGIKPLFPFGFGLSYTTFSFRSITRVVQPDGSVRLSFVVTNTGGVAGTDVAQAYLTFPAAAGEPAGKLVAFTPVTLLPGQSRQIVLDVPASAFQVFLSRGWTTVPGAYLLSVGDSSESTPLTASLTM